MILDSITSFVICRLPIGCLVSLNARHRGMSVMCEAYSMSSQALQPQVQVASSFFSFFFFLLLMLDYRLKIS